MIYLDTNNGAFYELNNPQTSTPNKKTIINLREELIGKRI